MPLHGEHEARVGLLQALHDAVRSEGVGHEARRHVAHGLVVEGVHPEVREVGRAVHQRAFRYLRGGVRRSAARHCPLTLPVARKEAGGIRARGGHDALEARARHDRHLVRVEVGGVALAVGYVPLARQARRRVRVCTVRLGVRAELRGEVLPQRAAQGHVHHLIAAADAEQRLVRRHHERHERALEGVAATRLHGAALRQAPLAVAGRLHVAAAGDEEAVKHAHVAREFGGVRRGRDDDGRAAGALHGLREAQLGDDALAVAVRAVLDAREQGYERALRGHGESFRRAACVSPPV